MITEKQYKEALSIVMEYKAQLIKKIEEINEVDGVLLTPIDQCYFSYRLTNAIKRDFSRYMNHEGDILVKDLLQFSKIDFLKMYGISKKTMIELENFYAKNGLKFKPN